MQERGFLRPLNSNVQTSKVIDNNLNTTWNQDLEGGKWKEMEQWREGQNSKEKLKGENGKKKEKKEWERANVLGHSQIMALQQIITHISAQNDSMIEEVDSGPRNHRAKPRRRK